MQDYFRPQGFAGRLSALTGWRRHGTAMGLGVVAALALPPIHAIPLLWLAFPGLVWLIDGARRDRGAFAAGWWWGFGHFSASFYWVAHALLTDPLRFGWMIPFAVFGLGAVVGVFPGLAAYAARKLMPAGVARVLMLAVAWTFFEWSRSWVLTGFPWNLIGTVWMPLLPVVQFASVVGTYGLGTLTVAVAALPAVLVQPRRRHTVAVGTAFALLALVAAWGAWRIPAGPMPTFPDVHLRLVQANVPQTDKWEPAMRRAHLLKHLQLSMESGRENLSAIIWPETAAPVFIDLDQGAREALAKAAPPHGLLITGAPRATPPGVEPFQLWNSLQAVNGAAEVVATYDKVHLVPFGEYMPYREILPIPKITAGSTDFSAGPALATLDLPGLPPAGPLICYEVIFPGEVVNPARRPDWLLNITNDGWFGLSAGPYQHFASARMRSVEEGLPLVRAANTGITAVVDPYGRVIAELPLGAQGILDSELPKPLSAPCPFGQFGNRVVFLLLLLVALISVGWHRLFERG